MLENTQDNPTKELNLLEMSKEINAVIKKYGFFSFEKITLLYRNKIDDTLSIIHLDKKVTRDIHEAKEILNKRY